LGGGVFRDEVTFSRDGVQVEVREEFRGGGWEGFLREKVKEEFKAEVKVKIRSEVRGSLLFLHD
jgi:hypothetical protein